MQPPIIPKDESARLQALRSLEVLDTEADEIFDRLTRLAKQLFDVPIALVSFVDENRQWFKSRQGLDICETGRDISFCGHAILGKDIFEIEDATQDPRFFDNPLVTDGPKIRFYAGAPLIMRDGYAVGTFCILDTQPRKLTEAQRSALRDLADAAASKLELHESYKRNREYEKLQKLTQAITRAQSNFIGEVDRQKAFDSLLTDVIKLTGSEYGLIGEVLYSSEGDPYLKAYAITNIAWNEATRIFYDTHAPSGLEFTQLNSLLGAALSSAEPVISNNPYGDTRRGGLPEGHPVLNAYLGIPIKHGDDLVAMIGLANREGGYDQAVIDYLSPFSATIGQLVYAARQKKQQKKDQQQIERLSKVASETSNAVIIGDVKGQIEWVNEGFTRITGYRLEEVKNKNPGKLLQGIDTDQQTVLTMRKALAKLEAFDVTVLNYSKENEPYWIRIQCSPLYDEHRNHNGFMAIQTDITKSKLAIEALQAERDLFSSGPVFVTTCSVNEHWPVKYVSENIVNILGYTPAEMMATDFRYADLIHPNDIERTVSEVVHNIQHHIDHFEQSYRLRTKEGAYLWFYDFTKLVRDEKGQVIDIRGYMFDQTEIKKIEQQLKSAKEEAEKANRAKSDFLSSMSHELRTPLNSIIGFSQLLVLSDLSDRQKDQLSTIATSSQHLLSLINDVLEFAKLESGKLSLNIESVEVRAIMEQVLALIEDLAYKSNIQIEVTPWKKTTFIQVDPVRFKQVLVNLISNGIKYNRPHGKLMLSWQIIQHDQQPFWQFRVKDTGLGIAQQDLPRLYEPFDRLGHEGSTIEGTGIGLSITKDLVEQMGGWIEVASELNVGTTFSVCFPLDKQNHHSNLLKPSPMSDTEETTESPASVAFSTTLKVLYVEDNAESMKLMAQIGQMIEGIELRIAPSAENGLQQAQDWLPQLIFLDIDLPGMNGDEALPLFKAIPGYQAQTPIIYAVTANVLADQVAHYEELGFDQIIAKPFDLNEVVKQVEAIRG